MMVHVGEHVHAGVCEHANRSMLVDSSLAVFVVAGYV